MRYLFTVVLAVFAALIIHNGAKAQTLVVESILAQGNCLIPSAGGSSLYGCSDPNALSANAQWDQPGSDLANYTAYTCQNGYTNCQTAWSVANSYSIQTENGVPALILRGNGYTLGCNVEFDNLANGINSSTYPGHPSPVLASVNIGALSSYLTIHATLTPMSGEIPFPAQCATTQANVEFDITLNDTTANQTLFYQIRLTAMNLASTAAWFSNSQPYGYRERLANLVCSPVISGNFVTWYVETAINCNVLPHLTSVITGATNGLDTNPNNWWTGSMYVGQSVWGGLTMTTKWKNVYLTAQ